MKIQECRNGERKKLNIFYAALDNMKKGRLSRSIRESAPGGKKFCARTDKKKKKHSCVRSEDLGGEKKSCFGQIRQIPSRWMVKSILPAERKAPLRSAGLGHWACYRLDSPERGRRRTAPAV